MLSIESQVLESNLRFYREWLRMFESQRLRVGGPPLRLGEALHYDWVFTPTTTGH